MKGKERERKGGELRKKPFAVPRFACDRNRQAFSSQVKKKAETVVKVCNLKTSLMLKNAWRNIPFHSAKTV